MPTSNADSTTSPPWHRQPGESPQAYAAFQCYLQLGAKRSLDAVGRKLYPTARRPGKVRRKRGKTGRLGAWSKRWRWGERTLAYIDHQTRREWEALEREQADINARMATAEYHRQGAATIREDRRRLEEIETLLLEKFARWEALEEPRTR